MRQKDRFYRALLILVGIFLWVSLSFAAVKVPDNFSWAEHFDLVNIIVGLLFMAVVSLIVRTINKIDRNQSLLFERFQNLSEKFYLLEGEHRAMAGMHKNHPDRD
jgi:uncharacterized membrane protein YhdT